MSIVKNFNSQIAPEMRRILKQEGEKGIIVFLGEGQQMLGHVELPMTMAGIAEQAAMRQAKNLLLLYLMKEFPRILKEENANFAMKLKQALPEYPIIDLMVCTAKKSSSFSQVIYF